MANLTLPLMSAMSVSSPERLTFLPARNLVPRWRTKILPARTACPSWRLTPRCFGWESRPRAVEPEAFFVAIL